MTDAPKDDVPHMSPDELIALLEALLFSQGGRLSLRAMEEATERSREEIRQALRELARRREGTGVALRQVGAEWQLHTAERFAPFITRLSDTRPKPLSRAAMEVLSVVAYRQPVVRADIDACATLAPFSHVYAFDVGFPPELLASLGRKFNASSTGQQKGAERLKHLREALSGSLLGGSPEVAPYLLSRGCSSEELSRVSGVF